MVNGETMRLPRTRGLLLLLVAAFLVAGCQVRGERLSARLYQTYPDTEVRHLGVYDGSHGDYGSIALLNGFGYLVSKDIQRSAIKAASINGAWPLRRGLFAVGHSGLFGGDFDDSRPL